MKSIVIAAPHSGSGKTTVSLGVMDALKRRGLEVAPFKVGPDFIDPGYHRLVTGTPSVNLDGWMCPPRFVRETFARHAAGADIAVTEGVMGLFDGSDGISESGSTAQIAKWTGSRVILVIDARSQARSAAALLHGFATFDPALAVAGVIFNNVASANHERILRDAVAAGAPGVAVLGCLPGDPALAIPARHLGLVTAEENPLPPQFLHRLRGVMDERLDLELLLLLADAPQLPPAPITAPRSEARVRIAVARDAAFCFVYEDNLRLLREEGAELVPFSPLSDPSLPDGTGGVYLPGGYPELFGPALSANRLLMGELREAIEGGMPVYAECGGFIYLTRGVHSGGEWHPMAGVFPVAARMLPRRKALGYREVQLCADGILGAAGVTARGHEFHYSEMEPMPDGIARSYRVSAKGAPLGLEGYRYKNCLASYIHLHFGSSPGVAAGLVEACRAYQRKEP